MSKQRQRQCGVWLRSLRGMARSGARKNGRLGWQRRRPQPVFQLSGGRRTPGLLLEHDSNGHGLRTARQLGAADETGLADGQKVCGRRERSRCFFIILELQSAGD